MGDSFTPDFQGWDDEKNLCGPAPEGQVAWTLRLLADKVVELGLATSISPETVRQTLKKTKSSLG